MTLSIFQSFSLSINQFINVSTIYLSNLPVYLSNYLSIYLSINQSINRSIYLAIYLSIYQSINQSINQSNLSINLSINQSIDRSIYLAIYPSLCVGVCGRHQQKQAVEHGRGLKERDEAGHEAPLCQVMYL